MRVLLVTPHFPPAHVGGVEHHTHRLADWLLAHGSEPRVVCVEELRFGGQEEVSATTDVHLGYAVHRLAVTVKSTPDRFWVHWQNSALEECLYDLIGDHVPAVMHVHSGYLTGGPALAAARRRRLPAVVTLHDLWFICPRITMMHPDMTACSGPDDAAKCSWCLKTMRRRYRLPDQWTAGALGRIARRLIPLIPSTTGHFVNTVADAVSERRRGLLAALRSAQIVLSPSRFVRTELERAGFEPGKIQVLPNGISASGYTGRSCKPRGSGLSVAYLGQLAPHKGVHVLVEAVRMVHSTDLAVSIFGPVGPHAGYVSRLRERAQGDPRIRFAGSYDKEEVDRLLADVDVVVVPSIWHENWPYVVLEAQRAGVPVVASRIGGLPEMIRHAEDGLLFKPGDPADLASAIQRLLDDPSLLTRLREGRRPVRSEDDQFAELLLVYSRAASVLP
jgi:glycosyltransferase involved in cell wall biosynthesis